MKKSVKSIFMVALVLVFLVPISAFAQYRPQYYPQYSPLYLAIKPGIYSPQSSDLDGFDTGFSGELALGFRFNPNLAGEFGVGYFNTKGQETFVGPSLVENQEFNIDVVPVTFTLKAILPYQNFEFFGLAGVGVYSVYGKLEVNGVYRGLSYSGHADDTDAIFGGYLGGGLHINLTRDLFIGAEGKYLWTDKARLRDEIFGIPIEADFKMNGYFVNGVIGIRF